MTRSKTISIGVVAIIVVIVILGTVYFMRGKGTAPAAVSADACISQQLSVGSTGNCVRDVQVLTNQMQANKLIEACPFTGGAPLEVTGTFDEATQEQIKVIQGWVNCYNAEESLSERLNLKGTVDSPTWTSLCTYGYTFPKQSNQADAASLQAVKAAGIDAGCH